MAAYSAQDTRRDSASSNKSVGGAIRWAVRRYKEHDRNVQAAWEAYYGVAPSRYYSRNQEIKDARRGKKAMVAN